MGRPRFEPTALAQSVAAACLSIAAGTSYGQASCPSPDGTNIVTVGDAKAACTLGGGTGLVVTSSGSVVDTSTTANAAAVKVAAGSTAGGVTNSGTIFGLKQGIGVSESGSRSLGNIANSGTIKVSGSGGGAIFVSANNGNVTVGTITNSNKIQGGEPAGFNQRGIEVIGYSNGNAAVGHVSNSGTIFGTQIGIRLVTFAGQASINGITNNTGSEIRGKSRSGIDVYAQTGHAAVGNIRNSGTIVGGTGGIVINTLSGTTLVQSITNYSGGIISSDQSDGIGLVISGASTVLGGIANSGTITGITGVRITGASTITGGITNHAGGIIRGTGGTAIDLATATTPVAIHNSGTLTGAVALGTGAHILNLNGGSASVTGAVSGGASSVVNVNGAFTTSNSFNVGDFNVNNGGTLNMGHGISANNLSVASGGVLNTTASNLVVSGALTNSGLITGATGIAVGSTSTLSGGITNSSSGIIRGTGGTALDLTGAAAAVTINNSGTLDGEVRLGTTLGHTLNLNGTASQVTGQVTGGNSSAVNVNGTFTTANAFDVGQVNIANAGVLNIAHSINAGQLNISGTGILNLNGTNASISGAVTGGANSVVNVNGTFTTSNSFNVGNFNISSGSTLNMGHALSLSNPSSRVSNAGKISVAAGTTATINGEYLQSAGGEFEFGASSASHYGKLRITGTVDLSASNKLAVKVSAGDNLSQGTVLANVLQSTGTLTAGPLTVTDNSAIWSFTAATNGANGIDVTTNRLFDTVTAIRRTGIGLPALGAAEVIDGFLGTGNGTGNMGAITDQLSAFPTLEQVANAVSQMAPLQTGGMAEASLQAMHGANRVVQDRLESRRGLSSGDNFRDRHFWIKPSGSWADQNDRNGVSGYQAQTKGLALGADAAVSSETRAGIAFSYSRSQVSGNSTTAVHRAKVDAYQAIAYGSHSLGEQTDLQFQAGFGMSDNRGSRVIRFGGIDSTASSDYRGTGAHVGAGISHILNLDEKTAFTPSLRIDYTYLRDRAYTETGAAGLNLKVNRKSTDELIIFTDGKISHALSHAAKLTANFGIGYDVLARKSSITAAFVGGGPAFTTEGLHPSPWLMRGGVALLADQVNGLEVTAGYDIEARRGFTNQTASVKFRLPF